MEGIPEVQSSAFEVGKPAAAAYTNYKMTEHFLIRRSKRKPKTKLLKVQLDEMEARLSCTDDSLLDITI